jgi:hypothetical protein
MASTRAHEATLRDLWAERASALARATERLEDALRALAEADRALAAAPTAAARELRREALAHAGERLWFLVVQREALGLHRHDPLYEVLRVPGEVRAKMGPAGLAGPARRR